MGQPCIVGCWVCFSHEVKALGVYYEYLLQMFVCGLAAVPQHHKCRSRTHPILSCSSYMHVWKKQLIKPSKLNQTNQRPSVTVTTVCRDTIHTSSDHALPQSTSQTNKTKEGYHYATPCGRKSLQTAKMHST